MTVNGSQQKLPYLGLCLSAATTSQEYQTQLRYNKVSRKESLTILEGSVSVATIVCFENSIKKFRIHFLYTYKYDKLNNKYLVIQLKPNFIREGNKKRIHHTGDKASLDQCG